MLMTLLENMSVDEHRTELQLSLVTKTKYGIPSTSVLGGRSTSKEHLFVKWKGGFERVPQQICRTPRQSTQDLSLVLVYHGAKKKSEDLDKKYRYVPVMLLPQSRSMKLTHPANSPEQ